MTIKRAVVRGLTPEDLASWYTPRDAVTYASQCLGPKGAQDAVWRLIAAGFVETAAASTSMTKKGQQPQLEIDPMTIPTNLWESYSPQTSDLWGAAQARFWIPGPSGTSDSTTVLFAGIRINPDDLRRHISKSAAEQSHTAVGNERPKTTEGEAKKRLPDPLLKAWYEVYKQAYGGTSKDTENMAEQSVAGMFPDKSVSRERIRELRGSQKRGRKQSESAK